MEHDPRPFQAVNIGMTSVETGTDRFPQQGYYDGRPPLAPWRCNVTALSQRYNLYFMATREGIAVQQPEFPFQKLHTKPKLYIPPTVANDSAGGYIDERNPHGINHLMVGDLGSEEILLVATDSGNIAAYHTRAIEEAIRKDPYRFSKNASSDVVGLRAFFSQWVHESAWGLSIHTQGRMIAVSANRPHHVASLDPSAKITVFAFALTSRHSDSPDVSEDSESNGAIELEDWYDWDPTSNNETPHRDRNFRITLGGDHGHHSNVPSVSFVNNAEDPDGSWLLSTDITGIMKLWRIWRGTCYASYDCEGTKLGISVRRQRDAGWIVAALDPSSFRPAMTMDQFCGYYRPRCAPQYRGHPQESYDITNIVRLKTPGRSQRHPLLGEDSEDEKSSNEEEVTEEWTDEEFEEPDRKRDLVLGMDSLRIPATRTNDGTLTHEPGSPERSSPQPSPQHRPPIEDEPTQAVRSQSSSSADVFVTLNPINDDDASESDSDLDSEQGDDLLSGSPDSHDSIFSTTRRTSVGVEASPLLNTSPESSGDSGSGPVKKAPKISPNLSKRPRQSPDKEQIRVPTIPALQCSQFHVRLLNIPKARSPHYFCANILTQDLPEVTERSNFAHLARLSMIQQIPELGIVIIASQLGRCAVCTLTKNVGNNALGLRVDWILPTRRQERAGYRPMHPLLGVAVAPIQGRSFQRPEAASDGEQEEEHQWARDRTVHGVRTTYDRSVLVLDSTARDNSTDEASNSSDEASSSHRQPRKRTSKPKRKRFRPSDNPRGSLSSLSSQASTTTRPFPTSQESQPWEAVESSRRYRLMLTYLDMTVLTYELERGVEREDVKGCESWRTAPVTVEGDGSDGHDGYDSDDDDDDDADADDDMVTMRHYETA